MAGVDWVKDMTARWVRILGAAGEGRTALDEAVEQVSAIGGRSGKKGRWRRLTQRGDDSAETAAVTVLSRQLVAGVLLTDMLLERLCAQTRQTRGELLDQLTFGMPRQLRDQQVRALQAELSGSCAVLRDPGRATYGSLGTRIEELLRLAEQQACEMLDAARAAAAELSSPAGSQPCPRRGAS